MSVEDGSIVRLGSAAHRDHEYDSANFAVLRAMQQRHFWYKGRHRFLLHALRHHLKTVGKQGVARVLDLGGGCGGWVEQLLRADIGVNFAEIALADSSLTALTCAQEVLPTAISLYHVDLRQLPWRDRWDLIFLLDVLEHLPDDGAALEQIRETLAPGGLLIITTPALRRFWSWNDELVRHQRRYNIADYHRLAAMSGLELIDARYFMFLLSPLLLARRWSRRPALATMSSAERQRLVEREHRVPPLLANSILQAIFACETPLGHRLSFPWGTSILAVLRKPLRTRSQDAAWTRN